MDERVATGKIGVECRRCVVFHESSEYSALVVLVLTAALYWWVSGGRIGGVGAALLVLLLVFRVLAACWLVSMRLMLLVMMDRQPLESREVKKKCHETVEVRRTARRLRQPKKNCVPLHCPRV